MLESQARAPPFSSPKLQHFEKKKEEKQHFAQESTFRLPLSSVCATPDEVCARVLPVFNFLFFANTRELLHSIHPVYSRKCRGILAPIAQRAQLSE